jgi:hypothetical protein
MGYYPPVGVGVIPPLAAGYGQWQTIGSSFLELVESLQGDSGDPADGFEAAFALVSTAVDGLGDIVTSAMGAVDDSTTAAAAVTSIGDEVSTELAEAQAVYQSLQGPVLVAIQALSGLGNQPSGVSLPGLPVIGGVDVGEAINLTQEIIGFVNLGIQDVVGVIDTQLSNMEVQIETLIDEIAGLF